MPINPAYEGDDFTLEENISDDAEQDGSFSRPENRPIQPDVSSTLTPSTQGEQQGGALGEIAKDQLETVVNEFYEHLNINWNLGPLDESEQDISITRGDFRREGKKRYKAYEG